MAKTSKTEPASKSLQTESFSLISNEKLLAIYSAMVRCRMLEQRAATLFQSGKTENDLSASSKHVGSAAAVGVNLTPDDLLSITPGDWLPVFVKGMPLEGVFRALANPKDDGLIGGLLERNIFVSSNDALQAEAISKRAAKALAEKKNAIVVVFVSGGSDSLKPWRKTMTLAAAKRLPIVFVHHVDEPPELVGTDSKAGSRNPEALVHGLPSIAVDALDPVAVYRVAYEAVVRARQGRGATLLRCTIHRNASTPNKVGTDEGATLPDPLIAMEGYLKGKSIEPEPNKRQVVDSFSRDLDLATRFLDR